MSAATPLRLVPVPKATGKPWPKIGDAWGRARHAIDLLEDRWLAGAGLPPRARKRYATRKLARRAVHELVEVAALISLHLPGRTPRDRAAQKAITGLVIEAMERACGCRTCQGGGKV